jgi:hypothetical protein
LRCLQKRSNPRNRLGSRLSSVPQVENETWIADRFPAETGWRNTAIAQKFLDFSKQMHF